MADGDTTFDQQHSDTLIFNETDDNGVRDIGDLPDVIIMRIPDDDDASQGTRDTDTNPGNLDDITIIIADNDVA